MEPNSHIFIDLTLSSDDEDNCNAQTPDKAGHSRKAGKAGQEHTEQSVLLKEEQPSAGDVNRGFAAQGQEHSLPERPSRQQQQLQHSVEIAKLRGVVADSCPDSTRETLHGDATGSVQCKGNSTSKLAAPRLAKQVSTAADDSEATLSDIRQGAASTAVDSQLERQLALRSLIDSKEAWKRNDAPDRPRRRNAPRHARPQEGALAVKHLESQELALSQPLSDVSLQLSCTCICEDVSHMKGYLTWFNFAGTRQIQSRLSWGASRKRSASGMRP